MRDRITEAISQLTISKCGGDISEQPAPNVNMNDNGPPANGEEVDEIQISTMRLRSASSTRQRRRWVIREDDSDEETDTPPITGHENTLTLQERLRSVSLAPTYPEPNLISDPPTWPETTPPRPMVLYRCAEP